MDQVLVILPCNYENVAIILFFKGIEDEVRAESKNASNIVQDKEIYSCKSIWQVSAPWQVTS